MMMMMPMPNCKWIVITADETATQAPASPQKDPSQQDDQQQGTSNPQKYPELTEQEMIDHDTNQQSLKDFQEKEENHSGTSQQEISSQQEVSNHEPQNEFLETDKSNSDTNQGECLEPNKQEVLNEEDLERRQDNVSHQIEEEVSQRKENNAELNQQDILEKEKLSPGTNQQDVSVLDQVQQEVVQKPEQEGSILQNVHPEDLHDEHNNPDLTALNAAHDQQELLQEILDEPIREGCPSVPVVLEKDQSTSKTESVGNEIDDESLEWSTFGMKSGDKDSDEPDIDADMDIQMDNLSDAVRNSEVVYPVDFAERENTTTAIDFTSDEVQGDLETNVTMNLKMKAD